MIRTYPAITLWQPWASLIATGDKRHETRAFPLPDRYVGEWVAIHAAARSCRPRELSPALDERCRYWWGRSYEVEVPYRRIVCLARFGMSIPTSEGDPSIIDRACGDWSPGRWAWPIRETRFVEVFEQPVTIGRQGWFSVRIEEEPEPGRIPRVVV